MADPFIAEIRIFTFQFAPNGWAFCDGSIIPIRQNTALFTLLGTTYGGDGRNTFALPDMGGRAPMFWGQGPGLSDRRLGEAGGSATVALDASQLPAHKHQLQHAGAGVAAAFAAPGESVLPADTGPAQVYTSAAGADTTAPAAALSAMGGGVPHNNLQPYMALSFCIALQGIFPSRW